MVFTACSNIHNTISQLVKQLTLQRFRKIVGNHIIGGAVFNAKFRTCSSVFDEEISDVHVRSSFHAGTPPIFLKKDRTHVVLV